jgi:hypothetical protein
MHWDVTLVFVITYYLREVKVSNVQLKLVQISYKSATEI